MESMMWSMLCEQIDRGGEYIAILHIRKYSNRRNVYVILGVVPRSLWCSMIQRL
jgi:hypothetical protein